MIWKKYLKLILTSEVIDYFMKLVDMYLILSGHKWIIIALNARRVTHKYIDQQTQNKNRMSFQIKLCAIVQIKMRLRTSWS